MHFSQATYLIGGVGCHWKLGGVKMWSKEFREQVNCFFNKQSYTKDELLGILENEVALFKRLGKKPELFKQKITYILLLILKIAIANNIDLEQELVERLSNDKILLLKEKNNQTIFKVSAADNSHQIQWQLSKEEVKELFGG